MQLRSTVRAIANKALILLGVSDTIETDVLYNSGIIDQFGNLNTSLDKYQQQMVTAQDIFQQSLSLIMNKPTMFREFRFTTAIGVADYDLEETTIEGFRANSFYNITSNGPGNRIKVVPYELYMERHARPETISAGAPLVLVPLLDDGLAVATVRLYPTPDQVYTMQGQCRHVVPSITKGSDFSAFPYRYENPLIMKLLEFMETRLNEGREGTARSYAEQFIQENFRDATGAEEEVDQQDCGFTLYSGRVSRTIRDSRLDTP